MSKMTVTDLKNLQGKVVFVRVDFNVPLKNGNTLKISPHHIHKTKAEHKHAIFVLCKIIAQVIADKENTSIPENVRNSLADLVRRSEEEMGST